MEISGWTVFWAFWIAQFLAVEGPAIFNKERGDTFSEHIWHWFSVKDKPKGWQFRRGILVVFLAWAAVHLGTGLV